MGPAYRTFAGMMICLFFAVALMILAGLAYVFNSWFDLAVVTSVPFVALWAYWWIIPESPRWLLSYGRIDEAEVIIQNIARWNRKEIPPNFVRKFIEVGKWVDKIDFCFLVLSTFTFTFAFAATKRKAGKEGTITKIEGAAAVTARAAAADHSREGEQQHPDQGGPEQPCGGPRG